MEVDRGMLGEKPTQKAPGTTQAHLRYTQNQYEVSMTRTMNLSPIL